MLTILSIVLILGISIAVVITVYCLIIVALIIKYVTGSVRYKEDKNGH